MSSRPLVVPNSPSPAPKPRLPVLRLSENFFRRWFFILVPVVVMALIGVLMAQRITPGYSASATVSTRPNPLAPDNGSQLNEQGRAETTAQANARVMNELLRTDRFAATVATTAGLGAAIENGAVSHDDIRQRLSVASAGQSHVNIGAEWGDPETSIQLVDALIDEYLALILSTVTEDKQEAVALYEDQRAAALVAEELAVAETEAFEATLPDLGFGDEHSISDRNELARLETDVTVARNDIVAANAAIREAEATLRLAQSEAGRSIEIVDPTDSTFEPESTLVSKAIIFLAFVLLGLLVAFTILLLSTVLDRSVRSAADIEAAGGSGTVAAVPVIKALKRRKRLGRSGLGSAPRGVIGSGQRAG